MEMKNKARTLLGMNLQQIGLEGIVPGGASRSQNIALCGIVPLPSAGWVRMGSLYRPPTSSVKRESAEEFEDGADKININIM
jgi:hypothetical protein